MPESSAWFQIGVGVAISAIAGGGGWLFGVLSAETEPPSVSLTPSSIEAPVGEEVTFRLETNADGGVIEWMLAGQSPNKNSVGSCISSETAHALTCRFAMPATVPVSATVRSGNGTSTASASVTVKFPGGYYGFVFPGLEEPQKSDAYRLMLTEFDWVAIQQSARRPIILYDPDLKRNVYAVSHQGAKPPNDRNALAGVRVMTGRFQEPGRTAFESKLAELGAVRLEMAFAEIYTALETGLAGSSMLTFDSLNDDLVGFQP